ncbi:hypothetical protein N7474_004393 [Penicillium riverlandense]|uniref:uncharacterized protein n=1 Tax=Penicillium riverlandense TaxID=1903569 RepID=UPI002549687F|nr:uncharacterized protein N7474_004393 [Penicillium riverlandense]KAJ5818802.1 hypothetical protein N7474_004393 [Penicillium riverlandense]
MKGAILATAAALMGSALAAENLHRRHDALHNRRAVAYTPSSGSIVPSSSAPASSTPLFSTPYNPGGPAEETCGCVTKTITYLGSPTLAPAPETSTVKLTTTIQSTAYSTYTVTVSPSSTVAPSPVVTLPTPHVTTFPSTGTYTVPATTVVVTDTTTVCGATSTSVPSGTHTIGGTTTVVTTETTITCPYATVKPSGSTVTSVVELTTYTCPAAGTYTVVPPTTTVVSSPTVLVWPTPQTVTPGTFTQPEQTITVVDTDYTYICPFATPTPSSSAMPTSVAAMSTSTAAPAPAPQPTGGSGGVLTGNGQHGMTYSPYTESGMCKTKDEVFQDIKTIQDKGFNLIRIYSTDCSGLMFVGEAARQYGMNMILGVYIDNTGTSGAQEQVSAIATWAEWDLVELIVVGNEAVQSGYATASELAAFIESSTAIFRAGGWTKDVTTTEPVDVWQQYGSTLCPAVDLVGANIHPFFNSETTAEKAGEFALSEYKILQSICPGKDVLNLETGWPNGGENNGAAVPGPAEQEVAIKSIAKYIGSKSIFFSFANDLWKSPGAFGVEQHWGCADVFH